MSVENKGKFVVSEGGPMAGKTTQLNLIKPCLGDNWQFYREPGGTPFGEEMRYSVQRVDRPEDVHPVAELFAYSASRAQLVHNYVLPALSMGTNVWFDRYWYSTYAYQGQKVDKDLIRTISAVATSGLEPELVLFFDILPELAEARKTGKTDLDIHDIKGLDFKRRVRDNYLELAIHDPDRWVVIDASRSIEEVFHDSIKALQKHGIWVPNVTIAK